MDKQTSFLIIIIIILVTYVYCSNQTKKLVEGLEGDYDPDSEDKVTQVEKTVCSKPALTKIDTSQSDTIPCQFSDVSCVEIMAVRTNKQDYAEFFNDQSTPDTTKNGWKQKKQCGDCIEGSMADSTIRRIISEISPYFGKDYCDGLAAECTDPFMYAYNKQDWDGHCRGNRTTQQQVICVAVLTNPFVSFFMSFMGGVTCTMKIKALELKASLMSAFDTVKNMPKNTACLVTHGHVPGVDCP
jgi:hypothetical protein